MPWWTVDDLKAQKALWQQIIDTQKQTIEAAKTSKIDDPSMVSKYPQIGVSSTMCSEQSLLCKSLMKEKGDISFTVEDCIKLKCPVSGFCADGVRIMNVIRKAIQFNLGQGGLESEEQREHLCVLCTNSEKCKTLKGKDRIPWCIEELKLRAKETQTFLDSVPEFKGI